jgi:hypothetical protein
MTELDTAITTKFKATSGTPAVHNSLYTYVGGRMYNEGAELGAVQPFVVFHELSDVYDYTFTSDFENILIQFNIYTDTLPESNTAFGYLKDLFDNCDLTISGYTHVYMRRERSYRMKIDNYFNRIVEYRILIEKN